MDKDHDSPFAAYLRRMEMRLRDLPSAQRVAILRELYAHLHDAVADQGGDPNDPHVQARVIAALGPDHVLAAQFGHIHGGAFRILRRVTYACGLFGGMLGVLLAPFAASTIMPAGLPALLVLLALLAVSGMGVWGVLLGEQHRSGCIWRVSLAASVLLVSGLQVFYTGDASLDLPAGLGLLIAGELLVCYLALSAPVLTLPRRQRGLLGMLGLFLLSGVAPCSYLPNPLGLAYLIAGSYTYRPNLPFINGFATLGLDPVPVVRARLDAVIDRTGLDPLDPVQPLERYTITSVTVHPFGAPSTVAVDLFYANGSRRSYRVPVIQYGHHSSVVVSGLDTLLAEHRAVGGIAFAEHDTPIALGRPLRLPLPEAAQQLGVVDLLEGNATADTRVQWAPDGQRFLLLARSAYESDTTGLWLLTRDGAPPRKLTKDAEHATWSADGQYVVVTTLSHQISAFDLTRGTQRHLGMTDDGQVTVSGTNVYRIQDGVVWRQPLDGRAATRVSLPGATGVPMWSPDGQRAAYVCATAVCLSDGDGTHIVHLALQSVLAPPIGATLPSVDGPVPTALPAEHQPETPPHPDTIDFAWNPDSHTLAISTSSYPQGSESVPARLWLVDRDGQQMHNVVIAPNGLAASPQWAANGRIVLINTFPEGGRRIIAVDTRDGVVRDLSQVRWDTFARVTPDGEEILVWNGRGGFWMVPLVLS